MKHVQDIHLQKGMSVVDLTQQLGEAGFQAQHLGEAIDILKQVAAEDVPIFLSFTSNMAASGLRGIIIDLVKKGKIAALITSSGSIDEDLIRAKMTYLQGSFDSDDAKLGEEGINRMGNVFVPNDRYEWLERGVSQVLAKIYKTQKEYTVSELLAAVGKHVEGESIVKAASDNNVPIYVPGITDGAFGMQLTFFKQKHSDFVVDVVKDFGDIMAKAMEQEKTAGIILGGGIAKHHTIIANLINGGFDYAIYINSSSPWRGSLSGATTEEAKSWGKVKPNARAVTIHGDAAIHFPLLIGAVEELL